MKHKHRVAITPQYEENFDIDIAEENIGQVFEVISQDGHKYKLEVVDPKKYLVRVTDKVNNKVTEGQITLNQGKRVNLAPFTSLPAFKGQIYAIIVEKIRRL